MAAIDPNTLQCQLEEISDVELASLIIEFVNSEGIAIALAEETLRRLTDLRVKTSIGHFAQAETLLAN
jgi:hypothetical protein